MRIDFPFKTGNGSHCLYNALKWPDLNSSVFLRVYIGTNFSFNCDAVGVRKAREIVGSCWKKLRFHHKSISNMRSHPIFISPYKFLFLFHQCRNLLPSQSHCYNLPIIGVYHIEDGAPVTEILTNYAMQTGMYKLSPSLILGA